jgi:hypothetical protein
VLQAANPSVATQGLKDALLNYADKNILSTADVALGRRLNAAASVKAVLPVLPSPPPPPPNPCDKFKKGSNPYKNCMNSKGTGKKANGKNRKLGEA